MMAVKTLQVPRRNIRSSAESIGTHSCSCVCREELEFIANTLIFILAGVIIAGNIYQSEHSASAPLQIKGRDYGYAVLLWIVLIVSLKRLPPNLF